MESTKELLAALINLGLNNYEANVYLSLIAEGTSTAKNMSDITGIPYGKIYEVIDSLAAKGFLVMIPSRPMKCQAVPPQKAIQNLKNKTMNDLDTVDRFLTKELTPVFQETRKFMEPRSIFWVLNGRSVINTKVRELIANAKDVLYIMVSENGLKRLVFHKDDLYDAFARGVKIMITTKITEENAEDVDSLGFCTIKNADNVKQQMFTNKQDTVIVEAVPDNDNIVNGRDIGLWMAGESFNNLFENLYHPFFEKASAHKIEKRADFEKAKVLLTP